MISAKEAREKCESITSEKAVNQLSEIEKKIESAIKVGKFEAYHYLPILDSVKKELIRLGYQVNIFNDRNETTFTIKW